MFPNTATPYAPIHRFHPPKADGGSKRKRIQPREEEKSLHTTLQRDWGAVQCVRGSARSQFPLPRWRAANVSQQPNRSASAPPSVVHKPASSFIHNRVDQLRAGAVASAPKARHRLVRSPNRAPSAANPSAPPWRTVPATHPLGTVRACVRDGE